MAGEVSPILAEQLNIWQKRVSEVLRQEVELSLRHEGVNNLVFFINDKWVLRLPKTTKNLLSPTKHSSHQIAKRMNLFAATGHCVRARYAFSAEELPPAGGLLTSYSPGRRLRLPQDLPLLADCFAALHTSRKSKSADKQEVRKTIAARVPRLAQTPIEEESRSLICSLLNLVVDGAQKTPAEAVPVLFDAHPHNFVVSPHNKAVAVDLEGDFIHSAAIDLAHSTLFSSLLWCDETAEPLGAEDIASFYQAYIKTIKAIKATRGRNASYSSLIAMRHLVICRTLSWMFNFLFLTAEGIIDAPINMINKARCILRIENLRKLVMNEEQLKKL